MDLHTIKYIIYKENYINVKYILHQEYIAYIIYKQNLL